MKGKRLLLAVALVTVGLLAWFFLGLGSGGPTPTYRHFPPVASMRPFHGLNYDYFAVSPFRNGRMWVYTLITSTNGACYHLDIESHTVIGELKYASPIYEPRPGSVLFCRSWLARRAWNEKFAKFIDRATLGNVRLRTTGGFEEKFWLLDLKANSAAHVDALEVPFGVFTTWQPSPSGRRAYAERFQPNSDDSSEVLLLEVDVRKVHRLSVTGSPVGWWNDNELLVKKGTDILLFDISTQRSVDFLSSNDVSKVLPTVNGPISMDPIWNGRDYDFYFKDREQLARLGRSGRELKPITKDLKFDKYGRLDPSAKFYVFQGKERENRNAVYVRDVETGKTTEIVSPNGSGRFSAPSFYGSDIIYQQSNAIWRLSLTNTNSGPVRLFPPDPR